MTKGRLRTKTGCLTCRTRRVKCGEEKPCCVNCSSKGRQCLWPSLPNLQDGRHRASSSRRRSLSDSDKSNASPNCAESVTDTCRKGLLSPALHSETLTIWPDTEVELIYHYLNLFLPALLVPNVGTKFLSEYQMDLVRLVQSSNAVRSAVLASCATNKSMLTGDARYKKLALQYYSEAVKEVSQYLTELEANEVPTNALIVSVIHLYTYNLWGPGTAADAQRHIEGAIELLTVRYKHRSPPLSMEKPFERVLVESVLYQAFLLAMRRPFAPDYHIDARFLQNTKLMLGCTEEEDLASNDDSPILGAPLRLYCLILRIIQFSAETPCSADLDKAKTDLEYWESLVLQQDAGASATPPNTTFASDVVTLYVMAASLLFQRVLYHCGCLDARESSPHLSSDECDGNANSDPRSMPGWQLRHALSIVRRAPRFETWARCYLGAWPMLMFGYAAKASEDVDLIERLLLEVRGRVGYGETQRILDELQPLWNARRVGLPESRPLLDPC